MRFVVLVYEREDPASGEFAPLADALFLEAARRAGVLAACAVLRPTLTATAVYVRGGVQLSDAPAVQSALALRACYLLDLPAASDALRWAARLPAARTGAVEVRPAAPWLSMLDAE